jgi:hypothetical protein
MNEELIRTYVANSQVEPLISLFNSMYDQRNRAELERDLYLTQLTRQNSTTRDESNQDETKLSQPTSAPRTPRQVKSKALEIDL